jgi:hypothetical protein
MTDKSTSTMEAHRPAEVHTLVRPAQDPEGLSEAVRILRADGAVVMPTDTVYGVGGDPWSPAAIERLYEIKLPPKQMAVPILLSKTAVAERSWSGGLIIVASPPRLLRRGAISVDILRQALPDLASGDE